MNPVLRKARPEDSPKLAELMNIAGHGIPAYLWGEMAASNEDVMAFGARRVARTEGDFSYTNAHVAVYQDVIVGMLLGYKLPDPYELGSLEEVPAAVRPLVQLEALAPGSWYINAIATDSSYRGQGVGKRLMRLAEKLAVDSGAETMSWIVAEDNVQVRALYERLDYQVVARRPIVRFPGCPHTGDWVLMVKQLKNDTGEGILDDLDTTADEIEGWR